AQGRLQHARDTAAWRDELDRLRERSAPVNDEANTRIRERDTALAAHASASAARGHIAAARKEQDNLDALESALRAAEATVAHQEGHRNLLITNPEAAGVSSRFGRGSQKALLKGNERELREKRASRDELRVRYGPLIASGRVAVDSHLRNALPYTPDSIGMLD